jgi:hypothetical protein
MANLTSSLKTFGSTGTEYPDGYNYLEGEQPVDEWDNYRVYHTIQEVHALQDTVNQRIESESGGSTGHPGTPETAHLYYNTGNSRLEVHDDSAGEFRPLLYQDGDTMGGTLDMGSNAIVGIGSVTLEGTTNVNGNDIMDDGSVVYDSSTGKATNADKLDGEHASAFADASHLHDSTYWRKDETLQPTRLVVPTGTDLWA